MFGYPNKWELQEATFAYDRRTLRRLSPPGLRASANNRQYMKSYARAEQCEPEFSFDYSEFRYRFHEICSQVFDPEAKDIAAAYFGAFFESWSTTPNLITPDERRIITAFMYPQSVDAFSRLWPTGSLVNVCRNPVDWFASAKRHHPPEYGDLTLALNLWKLSTQSALDLVKHSSGPRSYIVLFEDLILDTVGVMDELASRLGIERSPVLYSPTVGGRPVRSDSSFVSTEGIDESTLDRRSNLSGDQIDYIHRVASDLYEQAIDAAILH
jgi:hypothetical protein